MIELTPEQKDAIDFVKDTLVQALERVSELDCLIAFQRDVIIPFEVSNGHRPNFSYTLIQQWAREKEVIIKLFSK